MKKHAVELSINLIIITAIGLVVLVVLFTLFSKSSSNFAKNAFSCTAKGGECVAKGACQYQTANFDCDKKEEICCINPLKG